MSARQTQEQRRAAQAWKDVSNDVKDKSFASEYKSLVSSAPADVQSNGLGQTLAFWKSKGWDKGKPKNNEHTALYNHVSAWVIEEMKANGDLLKWITTTADSMRYRQATVETLAFLSWLKRFARAEL